MDIKRDIISSIIINRKLKYDEVRDSAMPTRNLEVVDILEALESKLAYIPGGRDREGRPLMVVNVPSELQPTTKPRLEVLIAYFLSIFR